MTAQQPPHPHCDHREICKATVGYLNEVLKECGKVAYIWCEDSIRQTNDGPCPHDTRTHSSSASQQRIEQVIKELQELANRYEFLGDKRVADAYQHAIALLRGEQHG